MCSPGHAPAAWCREARDLRFLRLPNRRGFFWNSLTMSGAAALTMSSAASRRAATSWPSGSASGAT